MTTLDPREFRPNDPAWHLNARDQQIPVRLLRPGLLLPPLRSWTQGYGQFVISVTDPPKGSMQGHVTLYDYDAPEGTDPIRIVTYLPGGSIECPIIERPDDTPLEHLPSYENAPIKSIDWGKVGRHPLAREVRRGDVLPPRQEHMLVYGPQRVTKLSMTYDGRLTLVLRDEHSTRRNLYHPEEAVEFPQSKSGRIDGANDQEKRLARARALANAKTVYWLKNPDTQQVFRVIKHPYGRGKWPRGVPEFEPLLRHVRGEPITVQTPREDQLQAANGLQHISAIEGDETWPDVPLVREPHELDYTLQMQTLGGYLGSVPPEVQP